MAQFIKLRHNRAKCTSNSARHDVIQHRLTEQHPGIRELIEHGKAARGKATIETQMILNHKTAIELLVENIDSAEFNRYTLMNLHSALSKNSAGCTRGCWRAMVYARLSTPPGRRFTGIDARGSQQGIARRAGVAEKP